MSFRFEHQVEGYPLEVALGSYCFAGVERLLLFFVQKTLLGLCQISFEFLHLSPFFKSLSHSVCIVGQN